MLIGESRRSRLRRSGDRQERGAQLETQLLTQELGGGLQLCTRGVDGQAMCAEVGEQARSGLGGEGRRDGDAAALARAWPGASSFQGTPVGKSLDRLLVRSREGRRAGRAT